MSGRIGAELGDPGGTRGPATEGGGGEGRPGPHSEGRETAFLLLPEVSTENYFEICLEYSIPNKVCPHNNLSYESLPCGVFIGAPPPT